MHACCELALHTDRQQPCCLHWLQALLGAGPSGAYVDTLQQAAAAGDVKALSEHALASCCLGPLWEEVRDARPTLRSVAGVDVRLQHASQAALQHSSG